MKRKKRKNSYPAIFAVQVSALIAKDPKNCLLPASDGHDLGILATWQSLLLVDVALALSKMISHPVLLVQTLVSRISKQTIT